jgi:uncharacterized protein
MTDDKLDYQQLVQDALRGVVREVLVRASGPEGFPAPHHLFLTFDTRHPEVVMPKRLQEQYPEEMTIVLQTHFWNLEVKDVDFSVTLSFQQQLERLTIPFRALTQVFDPSVPFGLRFEANEIPQAEPQEPAKPEESDDEEAENVVSLDRFRKK